MKLDVRKAVKDYRGRPIEVKNGEEVLASTLGELLEFALSQIQTGTPEEKYKRGKLCMMLNKKDSDYTAEDISLMKEAVGQIFNSVAVFTIHNVLDSI